jgi:5-methylcytosine-specific restriction endonuclease McrA
VTRSLHPNVEEYAVVLSRDPCAYCGAASATFDHIEPRAPLDDRAWDWDNLTAACLSCNSRKHDRPLLHGLLGFS